MLLCITATACEAVPKEIDDRQQSWTQDEIDQAVEFVIAPDAAHLLSDDESILRDAEHLIESLATMSNELGFAESASADQRIIVTFIGKGNVTEAQQDEFVYPGGEPDAEPSVEPESKPGFVSWDTVHLQTKNEFTVEFPRTLLHEAGEKGNTDGLHLGSEMGPQDPEELEEDFRGWSNADDTRIRRGTYDVAQTHSAWRKLVHFSNVCSGTLVGPKHVLTAAHCIRNNGTWFAGTVRAGRSGNAWRAEAQYHPNPDVASTWYWTPSEYRTLTDPNPPSTMPWSATPWDIGMIVTHTSRMGDVVGWMGWWWWSSDSAFAGQTHWNRGYPGCNSTWPERPAGCASFPNALWGDTASCQPQPSTGSEQSIDSDGINRRFRMHCDTSRGHSGSSTYYTTSGGALAVTGVWSWQHCSTCTVGNDRPNTSVRITKIYSDSISALRQIYP